MDRPVGNTADVYMECEKWYLPYPHPLPLLLLGWLRI